MVTRSQKIRVIVFISVVAFLLGYVLFIMIGQKLITSTDRYYVRLEKRSVTGLNVGQDVRYYGINIGKIEDISISKEDISEIIVAISVDKDTPIKKTVRANLQLVGITGLKVIELTGGDNDDPDLPPGSYIQANTGMIEDITGRAKDITLKVEKILNNLIRITGEENQGSIQKIARELEILTRLLNRTIRQSGPSLSKSLANLNKLIERGNELLLHVDKTVLRGRQDFLMSLRLLKETLENVNEFAIMLKDNPDTLLKGRDR